MTKPVETKPQDKANTYRGLEPRTVFEHLFVCRSMQSEE